MILLFLAFLLVIPLIDAASTLAPWWNSSSMQGVSARLQRRLFQLLAEPRYKHAERELYLIISRFTDH
jgi:hypothetical protein